MVRTSVTDVAELSLTAASGSDTLTGAPTSPLPATDPQEPAMRTTSRPPASGSGPGRALVTDLPGVFGQVAPYVQDYGYLAVGLFLLLKNIGIPVPGEAILVTAALVAGTGRLSLAVVILVGFVAAVVGETIGYAIGLYGGHPVVVKYGRRVGITHERLDHLEEFFARHGIKLVLAGRFLPLLRHWAGISAGISEMPWRRFLVANVAGAAVWIGLWAVLGARPATTSTRSTPCWCGARRCCSCCWWSSSCSSSYDAGDVVLSPPGPGCRWTSDRGDPARHRQPAARPPPRRTRDPGPRRAAPPCWSTPGGACVMRLAAAGVGTQRR